MARKEERRGSRQEDSEFEEKVLYINRSAKVVKGGRKFGFSALILVGDRLGRVGFGFGKANEVSDAIRKGTELARKNVFTFEREEDTIPHEITIAWDGSKVMLKPARKGRGIIAGSVVRSILELAGIKDIVAKSLGSNNPMNQVLATIKALKSLRSKKQILDARGISHD
ncbi:MAG: 30S ribosomal protein S5 [Parachlamydiales bacterium]|jgi:small subunit ribosomal protein S5